MILEALKVISSDIKPVACEYQEINPYGALNIYSVKINTSHDFTSFFGLSLIIPADNYYGVSLYHHSCMVFSLLAVKGFSIS